MQFPSELRYTKDHEWVRVEGNTATVGITEFAQQELGDIVFVDLPSAGKKINKGEAVCVVESTKAASDVYSPLSGEVKEANVALTDAPESINKDSYGSGWMVKLEGIAKDEIESLMTSDEYQKLLAQSKAAC